MNDFEYKMEAEKVIKQQANRIKLLEEQVAKLKEIIEKSIDMNNALGRM